LPVLNTLPKNPVINLAAVFFSKKTRAFQALKKAIMEAQDGKIESKTTKVKYRRVLNRCVP
jgi:hypothetical protein